MDLCVAMVTPNPSETAPETCWTDLVRRVGTGDQAALARLYDLTSPCVFGLVLRIVDSPRAAEEITLDVYRQVWEQAAGYRPEQGSAAAWLLMLARNHAIDWLRSAAGKARKDGYASRADLAPTREPATTESKRRRALLVALESLDPAQRQAIEMAYFSGLRHREIAARLQVPLGTVKTRIHLGMFRLKEQLQPYSEVI